LLIFLPDRPEARVSVGLCVSRCIHLPLILFESEVYSAYIVGLC
jgi:hypothetical protein